MNRIYLLLLLISHISLWAQNSVPNENYVSENSDLEFQIIVLVSLATGLLIILTYVLIRKLQVIKAQKDIIQNQKNQVENRLSDIVDYANVGITYASHLAKLISVNDKFSELLEYDNKNELIGLSFTDFTHPDDLEKGLILFNKISSGEIDSFELEKRYITKNNKIKWIDFRVSAIRDDDGQVLNFVGMAIDISKSKEVERIKHAFTQELEKEVRERTRELSEARADLVLSLEKEMELSRIRSKFVSTASHQFRTPLTVIQSSVSILTMQRHLMNEEIGCVFDKMSGRINGQVQKMVHLMNDVLNLGKINDGCVKANFAPVQLESLCSSVVSNYNDIQFDNRKMKFDVEGQPLTLNLDAVLIEQAISNLVSNALKYAFENSVSEMKLSFGEDDVKISVKDYGRGIPKEDIENLFDPFYRASNVVDISGTGLGTTIAKEYIEMNNGTLKVVSEVGIGSEFIIGFKKRVGAVL